MATVNLGRIKPVFRGAYSGSTAYVIDDIVTHGNESFICIQAHGAGTQATSQTAYWTKLAAKGTDGTDVGATITTQGDILYRDGSGLQRLAKGTASQVLAMNSGATAPEWAAAAEGGLVKIATTTLSSNAQYVELQNCFSATYDRYFITLDNARSDNSQMYARFMTGTNTNDTQAVYNSIGDGSYAQVSGGSGSGTDRYHLQTGDKLQFSAGYDFGDSAGQPPGMGHFWIYNPFSSTQASHIISQIGMFYHGGGNKYFAHFNGTHNHGTSTSVTSHTGIEFYLGSGDLKTGTQFTIFGLK